MEHSVFFLVKMIDIEQLNATLQHTLNYRPAGRVGKERGSAVEVLTLDRNRVWHKDQMEALWDGNSAEGFVSKT